MVYIDGVLSIPDATPCDKTILFLQAVGASIRIFDLLDRVPKVPNEGGDVYDPMDGRKLNTFEP